MVLYKEQNTRVRLNSTISELFFCKQWGKQGGPLSPLLFSLYLDTLLVKLRQLDIVAPNDTAYKQWSYHGGYKLLC